MSLTSATTVPARLGSTPDDYARIGVEPARSSRGRTECVPTAPGARTSGGTLTGSWMMVRGS
jgi:hypothetical protein